MTIEVLAIPTGVLPAVQRLTPDVGDGQQLLQSPFIGAQTVNTARGSERWKLELQFDDLTGANRAKMNAFVTRLRVSHNVFLCVNHTAPQRGVLTGTPLVNAGSYGGQNLNVYNLTPNVNSWACDGDFISVNSQLKMVLGDVGTSAGGVASLFVWPPLYDVPASGTIVVTNSPCGGFRALSAMVMMTEPPGFKGQVSIVAIERINSSMVADFLP